MIRSMTGFGRSQGSLDGLDLSVEINSVNRRNLEISVSLPREWQALERDLQALLRDSFHRGKLHLSVQALPSATESGFHWDEEGMEASLRRLKDYAARHGFAWDPNPETLVRVAALNKIEAALPESLKASGPLKDLVLSAATDLLAMREAEGAALGQDLQGRLAALLDSLMKIGEYSLKTVPRYREMLLQRLGQAGLELDLSDERVLKEIALFADKSDISEEKTRLESHFEQFRECLDAGSPIGRKLEFILQEINREFNTIGSKSNNTEVSRLVIEAKKIGRAHV